MQEIVTGNFAPFKFALWLLLGIPGVSQGVEAMGFSVKGKYFETCNCDVSCP